MAEIQVIRGGRSVWLDNLKGIAIILMVLGHSGAPFTHWIFLFHMAVFYMASGYTWNNKHVADTKNLRVYLLSKIKTLYVPYLLCNLVFLLLNNIFIDTYIYASSEQYLELIGSDDTSLLITKLSLIDMIKTFVRISLFMGGTQLGGPTWFFGSLFIALCVFAMIEFVLKSHFKCSNFTILFIEWILSIFLLVIAWMISEERVSFLMFNRLFAAYPLLVIGRSFKMLDKKLNWGIWFCLFAGIVAFVILFVLNNFGSISMARCKIENPLFFITASLAGWYFLASVSRLLPHSFLASLGASTRSIVMWHFISMKLVTIAYILLIGLPIVLFGAFPYLENTTPYMWIIYTIFGVSVPVILGIIYDKMKHVFTLYK